MGKANGPMVFSKHHDLPGLGLNGREIEALNLNHASLEVSVGDPITKQCFTDVARFYATAVKYMAGFGMGKQDLPKLLAGKVDEWLQKASKDEKTEKPVAAKKRKTEKKEKKDGQANRAKKWGV